MKKCEACIDSLYHGSAVDGRGLRSVVFFNGCNLRCGFCQNPETLYTKGRMIELDELVNRLVRYKPYVRKGGVTLSGGEPFMQAKFCRELLRRLAAEGMKVCIESNGHLIDRELIALSEYIILDVKNQDEEISPKVYEFVAACKEEGTPVLLTNVLVPGCNDDEAQLGALKRLMVYAGLERIKFLPFRKLCIHKYEDLHMEYAYAKYREATSEDVEQAQAVMQRIEL